MKILFCASEAFPFAKTGGLADVCGALPLALEKKGIEVAMILPYYRCVDLQKFPTKAIGEDVILATIGKNIRVYFLKNEKFYDRPDLYGDLNGDYNDNLDRFLYYCQRSLSLIKEIDFQADIIHCHDWQASLIPVFLKTIYREDGFYQKIKSILTVHNLAYQGLFPRDQFSKLGLSDDLWSDNAFNFYDKVGLLKAGIIYADRVTTVSPQYAKDIQTKKFGCGLEKIFHRLKNPVWGILNGVDYQIWNPEVDRFIAKKYSFRNLSGKLRNKEKLQEISRLPQDKDIPLFGFVGRIVSQKGLDIFIESIDELLNMNLQVVILGVGEERYTHLLSHSVCAYPKKLAVVFRFDESMAHQIYAGSDFLLMPSVHEPCGLSQMIALKYGTIPVVSARGGLIDTVAGYNPDTGQGNGFVMKKYTVEGFQQVVGEAMRGYSQKTIQEALVRKALTFDFSWDASAIEYKKLYTECLSLA